MKAFRGLLTNFTFSIIALAVQATPLPALNNAQLVPHDVPENPSTTVRNHDAVHLTRSSNPFDLSAIFSRTDAFIKDEDVKAEPTNTNLAHIPLAPSISSSQLPDQKVPNREQTHNLEVPLHSIPSNPEATLRDLEARGQAALRDKQVFRFEEIRDTIALYLPRPNWIRHNDRLPIDKQKLAQQIYRRLNEDWRDRDYKDIVKIDTKIETSSRQPIFEFSNHTNPWDAMDRPEVLPEELHSEHALRPEGVSPSIFELQRSLDLGNAYIKGLDTHNPNFDPNKRIIVGYQLILLAAVTYLEHCDDRSKDPSLWLLYSIRDAKAATETSPAVKACLERFDNYLTDLVKRHRLKPVPQSNWTRGPRGGRSKRENSLIAFRETLEEDRRAFGRPSRSGA
ncbi:hypothetical protein H0H93_010872 [Arthromyces matolae]|nr:hypothetical protein H0H93_010872 [Arthromyces matolae]